MLLEINAQRQEYFNTRGRIVLNACPGSGKTTCVVHKISLLEEECLRNHGYHSGIACLSFTNVAKDEILQKYRESYQREIRYPHEVLTIDSFLNRFITLPYFCLLDTNYPKRPRIIDQDGVLDKLTSTRYQSKGKWVDGIVWPLNQFKGKDGFALFRSYPASSIWIDVNRKFTFKGKLPKNENVDPEIFQQYGAALFKWKMAKGYLTSLDSAFVALAIIKKHKNIAEWLITRFPYLLVDEAQDNSEIQHAIFDELISSGLQNIEFIGDPYQSLYEWRDAKPKLFIEKYESDSWIGLPLSENRRSVQKIIECYSLLRQSTDPKIFSTIDTETDIPITIYKYNEQNPSAIVSHFEQKCNSHSFTKNHIVVRGNTLKNKMMGITGDINPWKNLIPTSILRASHSFETKNVKDAVRELRKVILPLQFPDADYQQLQTIQSSVAEDYSQNATLYEFLHFIPDSSKSFELWSAECLDLLKHHFGILDQTTFDFKSKMNGFRMADLKKQPVNKYFDKSASAGFNIPITTIHQIKGATLDAILCFFGDRNGKETITFDDFVAPLGFPSEKQRMIYVACSRPKQLLALAFPEKITDVQLRARFGQNIDIVKL
jgi:DNA helicase-2/ATP-dependent DNA helicase PcrA